MGTGPSNPTPLALAFYEAYARSGYTMETIARRAGLSVPTVSAYLNGTRGSGGQARSRATVEALAEALGMDIERTLKLAGLSIKADVIEAIKADVRLSQRDKEMLISLYEQRRRPHL